MEQRTLKLEDGTIVYCYEDGSVEWFIKPYNKTKRTFGFKCNQNYRQARINGKQYRIHRLIALAFIPNADDFPEVDHINRCTFDNRACNLRWVNRIKNMENHSQNINALEKYGFRPKDNIGLYKRLYNLKYYKVKNPKQSKYTSPLSEAKD